MERRLPYCLPPLFVVPVSGAKLEAWTREQDLLAFTERGSMGAGSSEVGSGACAGSTARSGGGRTGSRGHSPPPLSSHNPGLRILPGDKHGQWGSEFGVEEGMGDSSAPSGGHAIGPGMDGEGSLAVPARKSPPRAATTRASSRRRVGAGRGLGGSSSAAGVGLGSPSSLGSSSAAGVGLGSSVGHGSRGGGRIPPISTAASPAAKSHGRVTGVAASGSSWAGLAQMSPQAEGMGPRGACRMCITAQRFPFLRFCT